MPLTGSRVKDSNYIFRFSIIAFIGIIAGAGVLYWKSQLLLVSDFKEFPESNQMRQIREENKEKKKFMEDFTK